MTIYKMSDLEIQAALGGLEAQLCRAREEATTQKHSYYNMYIYIYICIYIYIYTYTHMNVYVFICIMYIYIYIYIHIHI